MAAKEISFDENSHYWWLDFGVELTTIEHRYERKKQQKARIQHWLAKEEQLPLSLSLEQTAAIIAALSGGPAGRFVINIPNRGQINNLPQGAAVKCMARIDQNGVHPELFGDLPPAAHAVTSWHLEEMALTIEAAITGDRAKAMQAIRMDPAVTDWHSAERLLDELLTGNAKYLPQF